MNSHRHIPQSRIQELQTRRERLVQKLRALSQQRDIETRVEEKLRMDAILNETETDRRQVEAELLKLEDEWRALNPLTVTSTPAAAANQPRPRPSGPVALFYSYAHEDETLRERLEVHLKLLKRQGILQDWHDRDISAGSEWAQQISAHLESADLILLLLSLIHI